MIKITDYVVRAFNTGVNCQGVGGVGGGKGGKLLAPRPLHKSEPWKAATLV